ncbi:MAG: hypothetical protein KC419_26910, partial [Anaerolineales bacterium]|nr:hypothetical protein [Anaerolineales bacterium]
QRVHSTATLVALAPLYAQVDAADVGESLLLTAVVQEPGSLDVLLALGDFYVGQGNTDAAWDYYQQLLTLSPGLPIGYLRLSNLANDLGDRTQADLYAALVQELGLAGTSQ